MGIVHVLSTETVNQIAAGEVIERPASVVKELAENAADSGATRITVEIADGGVSLVRVTDNGSGFASEDIRTAFLRHATSKISCGEDLWRIHSLGFRGEALSSIAAVAKVELLTYNEQDYLGSRYVIEGGEEVTLEEAGCPAGTTMFVRDLFYNVPARRKFLKSATTEAGYCNEWLNRFAVSHPEIAVTFLSQGRTIFHTPGNGKLKDTIFAVYGREIAENLLPVSYEGIGLTVSGCIGATVITRSNRNMELCFVNGRDVRSRIVMQAVEEAYRTYVMQHKYPFTALFLTIRPDILDVNIHPTKSDVRFTDSDEVSHAVYTAVRNALTSANLIRMSELPQEAEPETQAQAPAEPEEKKKEPRPAESFEVHRIEETQPVAQAPVSFTAERVSDEFADVFGRNSLKTPVQSEIPANPSPVFTQTDSYVAEPAGADTYDDDSKPSEAEASPIPYEAAVKPAAVSEPDAVTYEQLTFADPSQDKNYRIVGQVFNTYWIIELPNQMMMIDQHAAHERINYERLIAELKNGEECTQQIAPPEVVTLSMREEETFLANREHFTKLGFDVRELGGQEYGIYGAPTVLLGIPPKDYFQDTLELLSQERRGDDPLLRVAEKVASMSCKAAIKGGQEISLLEAKHLISELMKLENPYHCPHGRPIIVSMTKTDMEKRFKRIV